MQWLEYLALLVVALVVTLVTVPFAERIAHKTGAIDYPAARRVNTKPIPRLGGIAMFLGLCAALIVLVVGVNFLGWTIPVPPRGVRDEHYTGICLGVIVMFLVGVVDDVKTLRPLAKFIGQIAAACLVAGSGLLLDGFFSPLNGEFLSFGILSYPITVFYLVAFANIINLIDGLDGLAAGITAIASITVFYFAVTTGEVEAAFLSIALFGVCVGFLRYNFNPASIFMGDSGALLLGFSLGVVSLFAVAKSTLVVSLLIPILAAGVPIIDTFAAIVRRKRAGQKISEADRGHIHHRLLDSGLSQRTCVLIMWGWTAILSICAGFITTAEGPARIIAALVAALVTVYGVKKLHLLGPVLKHHYAPRGHRPEGDEVDSEAGTANRSRRSGNRVNRGGQERDRQGRVSGNRGQRERGRRNRR